MKRSLAVLSVVVSLVCLSYGTAYAQFGALGKLKKAADEVKSKKPDLPKTEEKPADAPKPDETKSDDAAKAAPAKSEPAASAAEPSKTDASGQPVMTAVKIDFVPGEKTVFYDDFSDMAPDEPPPHWKVRGDAVQLRLGANGVRDLAFASSTLTSGKIAVPKNFTFEVTLSPEPNYQKFLDWKFKSAKDDTELDVNISSGGDGYKNAPVSVHAAGESIGSGSPTVDLSKPINVAVWMQQGRLRVYENGERIVDANQVELTEPIDHVVLEAGFGKEFIGLRSVRIAESTPDFGATLANSGKYVSHGIHFAVDSDKLLPESAPVLKMIAGGLLKNPSLKLTINGYTDSTGDAAHNLDLSKRRAAAVREVLASQFGIDQARLTADGFGPQSPVASNDTADGRAENRRVEFVKQ